MKRFVVSTNLGSTQEQDSEFVRILKAEFPNVGWWHQLSETWLIVDPSNTMTCTALRNAAMRAWPNVYLMVVEASESGNWAGFAPTQDFLWLKEWWKNLT